MWTQSMKVFLGGRKLWRYEFGDVVAPKPQDSESLDIFACHLEN